MPNKVIAKFSVSHLQILDENGKVDAKLDPKLPDSDLLKLYTTMMLSRRLDERMLKLQRQGRLGTLPVCVGQEAASAGPAMALSESDWFVGAYRELAGRLLRGEDILNPMLVYNGFEEGNITKENNRILPIAIILASQLPYAVGIGYANKMKKNGEVVLSFNGDGSASEGDFHEALNFASVWKTPNVFVVQNNHWAISTPLDKQMASQTIAQRGIAYDMPTLQVDGNDALAMYKATSEAVERARKGKGPTLIEALTYRMLMHTTADDPKKYRDETEVEDWVKRDPITRFRLYLENCELWNDQMQETLESEIKNRIEDAVKRFENFTNFKLDAPFDFIFGQETNIIEEQRREFLENMRKDKENA